jgi:hypothetical protein
LLIILENFPTIPLSSRYKDNTVPIFTKQLRQIPKKYQRKHQESICMIDCTTKAEDENNQSDNSSTPPWQRSYLNANLHQISQNIIQKHKHKQKNVKEYVNSNTFKRYSKNRQNVNSWLVKLTKRYIMQD